MDEFYQTLRQIQKKERNNGTLARVEETFYTQLQKYINVLKQEALSDPFSNVHGLLKQSQIIATEICERREHKITDAAVVNNIINKTKTIIPDINGLVKQPPF